MLSIRDGEELARALASPIKPEIKDLLRTRWNQVAEDLSDEDIADLVQFVIVEPGDTVADLERAIGFRVCASEGELGFSPEWAEYHEGFAHEFCWVFSDDGAGAIAIIPCQDEIDADLRDFCAACASSHA
jgi:hypothetical protein